MKIMVAKAWHYCYNYTFSLVLENNNFKMIVPLTVYYRKDLVCV